MSLVLPEGHPSSPGRASLGAPLLRIGIINVMPKLESYEPLLLGPLSRLEARIEPVFLKLETHAYQSSARTHLDRFYRPLSAHLSDGPLDGIVLTGAPVEELDLEAVHYWPELRELLSYARTNVTSTLGLCWGGLALAGLLGIPKTALPRKLFGVFENRPTVAEHALMIGQANPFSCAHSRHSGIMDHELERAERDGLVRLLSHSEKTGYSLFATPDTRFVAHLGHPEYVAERLVFEWQRDQDLGRTDVPPPERFNPRAPETSWNDHRETFFSRWIDLVANRRTLVT